MRLRDAVNVLAERDALDMYVYRLGDLAMFFEERGDTLAKTVRRLVAAGVLERAARGVLVYVYSKHRGAYTIEDIALTLRRYEYNYVSFESALSQWGAISQIPVGWLTVATTGREGEFHTPYGVIEFTHTDLNPLAIMAGTIARPPHPLPIASAKFATRNLRRTGRNVDLVETQVL